jgi:3-hydroxyacyl-[acyl-carrier-protein] dehydratase
MAGFVVAADHPALPGHFPGRPIVPGVVILDHVLAAIESAHGPLGALRLPQVKFMQPLLPGQAASIAVHAVEQADAGAPRWRFRVESAGVLLASGEVAMA